MNVSNKLILVSAIEQNGPIFAQCINQLCQNQVINPITITYTPSYTKSSSFPQWKANLFIRCISDISEINGPTHTVYGLPRQSKKKAKQNVFAMASHLIPILSQWSDLTIQHRGRHVVIVHDNGELSVC